MAVHCKSSGAVSRTIADQQRLCRRSTAGELKTSKAAHFAGGRSQVARVFVKKDGQLGRRNSSDAVESAEFEALLSRARDQMGQAADGILAGVKAPPRVSEHSRMRLATSPR